MRPHSSVVADSNRSDSSSQVRFALLIIAAFHESHLCCCLSVRTLIKYSYFNARSILIVKVMSPCFGVLPSSSLSFLRPPLPPVSRPERVERSKDARQVESITFPIAKKTCLMRKECFIPDSCRAGSSKGCRMRALQATEVNSRVAPGSQILTTQKAIIPSSEELH